MARFADLPDAYYNQNILVVEGIARVHCVVVAQNWNNRIQTTSTEVLQLNSAGSASMIALNSMRIADQCIFKARMMRYKLWQATIRSSDAEHGECPTRAT